MKTGPNVYRRLLAGLALLAALPATAQNLSAPRRSGPTAVTVSPTSLSFGNQAINSTSPAQQVTLTNNQTTALTITSVSLNLSDYAYTTTCPISPQTLAAGASCNISISFTPSVTGPLTATLIIFTDSGTNPMVSLSGTGVLPVVVSPSALVFGSEKVGTSSPPQTVTLTNNQSTALTINSVTSSLGDFLVNSTCPIRPKTLAVGGSCATSLSFKPTTTGTRTGTLSFVDSANSSPQVVSLIGTGSTSTLVSIAVSPSSASVGLGANQQFSAMGTYADHSTQNVTPSSNWASSATSIATVSAGGLASTLAQGTTNISATSGTIVGTAKLTVTAPVLVSIAISPANPSLSVGMSQQLTATGTYTDGSTQDLTGSVTWISTAKSIASVTSAGMATGVSAGQATIKSSLGSITGSTQVTVVQSTVAYYVSPTGKDTNPGTLALPLATAQKAESLVVANYLGTHCASQKAPIIVQFRAGTWANLSLNLTSADSGCSASAPVVFENYPGETPIFSGGVRVLNWVNTSGNTWQTTLPANTVNFEALYYNGARRQRPRLGSSTSSPLGTYYRVAGNVAGDYDRFYYNPGDPIATTWKNYAPAAGNPCGQAPGPTNLQGDIQVGVFEQWDVSWERISCIDTTKHLIYLTGSTDTGAPHGYILNHRYIVENIKDKLAVPGQWFLDRTKTGAWILAYIANPGENPNLDTVIIPQQPQVVAAVGVQYRTFYGLTFSHDNYVVDPAGYPGSQSELLVTPAVQCLDCSHVTFDSNSFTNIEGYGLSFSTDNTGTAIGDVIQNNAFWDLGAGGLMTGRIPTGAETDANVFQLGTIQNNLIQGIGRKFPGAAGIANLLGHDVTTTHNDVTDGYSEGIMICFPGFSNNCAGTSNSNGGFNQAVEYNHIWNLGQGILNDFGGVYMATYNAAGDTVTNNKIHDLSDASSLDSDGYGGNGFYIDRGGPIELSNNLVYRTNNAFNITMGPPSAGQIITANNNIFAFTRKSIINTYACAKAGFTQFSFSNNIFLQDRTYGSVPSSNLQNGATYLGNPTASAQDFASNDYWNTTETFATDTKAFNTESSTCQNKTYDTFPKWQSLGEDIGSLSVNPGFTSPTYPSDNFTFLSNPPNIGFVPFSTSGTCPSCPGRSNPLINPGTVPAGFPTAPFNPATDY
ncbi:MAG TPA: choice-of-anchor D domain-containing protein [Candidatus Dormibacteraeota bacterium]|nr:choice-of-anchor D domain-containing protein [Candidatus Dormibacteraeota bacterium]